MSNMKPEIRFGEFADAWEQRKLGEIVKTELKGKAKAEMSGSDSVYLDANYLNGGEKFYVDSPSDVEEDDVLILWDGSQAGTVYHGFKGALGSTLKAYKPKYSGGFLYQQLKNNQQLIYNSYRTPNIPHVVKTFTDEFTVYVPNIEEQLKISCLLSNLDNLITLHQRKLNKIKNFKSAYLSKMFPKEGERYPRLRFAGFTDAWEQRKLGDIGDIITGSTPSTQIADYYSDDGIPWVTPTDISENITYNTEKRLSIEGQKVGRVVPKNTILITCIASIGKNTMLGTKGSFNQQINGLIPNEDKMDPYFLFTESTLWSLKMKKSASAGTMQIVNKTEFSSLTTMVPGLNEQTKIGKFFKQLDNLITLHQRELEKLKQLKQAMLKKMFV